MTTRAVKVPNADHPISIERHAGRVIVTVNGKAIANTTQALSLREAKYPAVFYIPRADVDMARLVRTDKEYYCPYKGDCSFYSIPDGGARADNAVWSYEAPFDAVLAIKDHLAFYPDRVDAIEELPAA
jgi:uncharacterized protein (DUF427 family)